MSYYIHIDKPDIKTFDKTYINKKIIQITPTTILDKVETLSNKAKQQNIVKKVKREFSPKSDTRAPKPEERNYSGIRKDKPQYNLSFDRKEKVFNKGFKPNTPSTESTTHYSGQEPLYKVRKLR